MKYLREVVYMTGTVDATHNDWMTFYSTGTANLPILEVSRTKITYTAEGYISEIEDTVSDRTIKYQYSGNKVSTVTEYGGTAEGQTILINYGVGYTELRTSGSDDLINTSDDTLTRYIFDSLGRTVGAYSTNTDGTRILGASTGKYEEQENIKNNIKETATVGGSQST